MFDIYDPSTYSEVPENLLNGRLIVNDTDLLDFRTNEYISTKQALDHITNEIAPRYKNPWLLKKQIDAYILWLYNMFTTESPEKKQARIETDKKNREALIDAQLRNLRAITRKNRFNPRDENTYKYAKGDVITVIDGLPIYESVMENNVEKKTYLFETEFVTKIYDLFESYGSKEYKTIQEFIDKQIKMYLISCKDYTIKKSDLLINGYHFSVAQKEMIKHLSLEEIKKITDIIFSHFKNKEKRYRLRQELFYQLPGKIDNDLFAALCFVKDSEKEQEIMEEYYHTFEEIKTKDELKALLDNDYIKLYPELKTKICQWFKDMLGI